MVDRRTIEAAIGFAELALEPEKNQIINAVRSECIYSNRQEIAEKYYEDTFIEQV
jgi:hypothetical protein